MVKQLKKFFRQDLGCNFNLKKVFLNVFKYVVKFFQEANNIFHVVNTFNKI